MSRQLISERLTAMYNETSERVGFVKKDGSIIEVENISAEPDKGFLVSAEVVLENIDAAATWHTHPLEQSNLSPGDHESFINFPDMEHFIVGEDGVRVYTVEKGSVLCAEEFISTVH